MSSDQSPYDSTSFKVAFIGAGSIGFTRKLVGDILTVPEFAGIELAFMDISEQNLSMVERLVRRDLEANGLDGVRLTGTLDQREAVSGARYVFCTARIGGLPAFATDIEVPLRYGIDQCVGDTLCAGGIMYGQRGIPVILALCKDIREAAEPGCRFFNYSNPMAMLTWAANRYGGVPTVGLCHGVQGGHTQIADALGIPADELDYRAAGINHQTWYVQLLHRGRDVSGELLAAYERHPVYRETERVRIEMLRRFGCYSTESNGHLSEYVPWFRKRPDEIRDWIDMSSWILGETGATCACQASGATGSRRTSPAGWPNRRSGTRPKTARPSTAPTSWRGFRPDASTAATSTSRTAAASPTCRTTPASRCRATSTAPACTSRGWAICRSAAPPSATPASPCSGSRSRPRCAATSGCWCRP